MTGGSRLDGNQLASVTPAGPIVGSRRRRSSRPFQPLVATEPSEQRERISPVQEHDVVACPRGRPDGPRNEAPWPATTHRLPIQRSNRRVRLPCLNRQHHRGIVARLHRSDDLTPLRVSEGRQTWGYATRWESRHAGRDDMDHRG